MLTIDVDLRQVRRQQGIGLSALARTLGVHRNTLEKWEKDPGRLRVSTLRKWAGALGLEVRVTLEPAELSR